MTTRGFSRRDLLQLGGKLVLSVGAAHIVVALPGCGGSESRPDAPIDTPLDAYYPGYPGLDDCHSLGTKHYAVSYNYLPYYAYTYHYYFTGSYGCAYPPYDAPQLHCYYDRPDFAPGYYYFCFTNYYYTTTMP
jgi:hypothetical protein